MELFSHLNDALLRAQIGHHSQSLEVRVDFQVRLDSLQVSPVGPHQEPLLSLPGPRPRANQFQFQGGIRPDSEPRKVEAFVEVLAIEK